MARILLKSVSNARWLNVGLGRDGHCWLCPEGNSLREVTDLARCMFSFNSDKPNGGLWWGLKKATLWGENGRAGTRDQVVSLAHRRSRHWWVLFQGLKARCSDRVALLLESSPNFVFQSMKLQSFSLWSVLETVRSTYLIHTCFKITHKWNRNIMTTPEGA